MAQLGYVGLGVMGSRVAKRLMDAGHTVTGYNRTRSKAQWLIDAGMQWADSPATWPRQRTSCSRWSRMPKPCRRLRRVRMASLLDWDRAKSMLI